MLIDVSLSRALHPPMALDDGDPWTRESDIEQRIETKVETAFPGADVCAQFGDEEDDEIDVREVAHRSEVLAVVRRIVAEEVARG